MKTVMFEGHMVDMIDRGVFDSKVSAKILEAPYDTQENEEGESAKTITELVFTVSKKARLYIRRRGRDLEFLPGDKIILQKSENGHNIGLVFDRVTSTNSASKERVIHSDFESIDDISHPEVA